VFSADLSGVCCDGKRILFFGAKSRPAILLQVMVIPIRAGFQSRPIQTKRHPLGPAGKLFPCNDIWPVDGAARSSSSKPKIQIAAVRSLVRRQVLQVLTWAAPSVDLVRCAYERYCARFDKSSRCVNPFICLSNFEDRGESFCLVSPFSASFALAVSWSANADGAAGVLTHLTPAAPTSPGVEAGQNGSWSDWPKTLARDHKTGVNPVE
jgi:hypothetical protein